MKQIKLFLVNYEFTLGRFGEDQKGFHKSCFEKLLHFYRNEGVIPLTIEINEGELKFTEAVNSGEHLLCKYYFKPNKAV